MLDRSEEYDRMAECEQRLWWYRALHERTGGAIRSRFGDPGTRILDAGCGTGGLMMYLQGQGYKVVEGFDLSESAVAYCRSRGLKVQQLDLRQMAQHYAGSRFDVIVSNDTICYLDAEEREAFLSSAHDLLNAGGLLVFNAPAFEAFSGTHDQAVGIGKRFQRRDIRDMRAMAGMVELTSGYWPFLLSPAIFLVRSLQRRRLSRGLVKEIRSDVSMPPGWINQFLLGLCRAERKLLGLAGVGSSLFVVLRRR